MPELRPVGVWFGIAGIALATQGCWENDEVQLTLLGEGACRTFDGGEGQYETVAEASEDACKARCFTVNEPCSAVEFNSNDDSCEVHFQPIDKYEKQAGVTCYVMK
jgi:hypothetical protein